MAPQQQRGAFSPPSSRTGTRRRLLKRCRRMEGKQGPPRVLVVEDDFLIAMQTEIALTAAGFEVVGPAATAEEAVALAGEAQPALAVMDIRLASTRDGIDAARQLYQDFAIRCIFATAHQAAYPRRPRRALCPARMVAEAVHHGFACCGGCRGCRRTAPAVALVLIVVRRGGRGSPVL